MPIAVNDIPAVRPRTVLARVVWAIGLALYVLFFTRYRTIPLLFLAITGVGWLRCQRLRRTGVAIFVLVGFLALEFASPFDISTLRGVGGPRIVRVVFGKTDGLNAAAARGDVLLAGCLVTGIPPRWIVVW